MNLYLRLIVLLFRAWFKPPLKLLDTSILRFRVLPNDLDINLHMNNGRFLSIMDLGRIDIIARIGLLKHIINNKWIPIVGHVHMHYRRPLKLFQIYELHSRIVSWDEKWTYVEHHIIRNKKTIAVGIVQGLIRSKTGNINSSRLLELLDSKQTSPAMTNSLMQITQFNDIK